MRIASHQPCIDRDGCGSSDALELHEEDDGSLNAFCHSCKKYFNDAQIKGKVDLQTPEPQRRNIERETVNEVSKYPIVELKDRGISKEAAEYYGIRVSFSEETGEIVKHYYPYGRDGKITGYKVRVCESKKFYSIGDIKSAQLFGWQNLKGTKFVIITEGECDAAAAYDILKGLGKNYAVVSTKGAGHLKVVMDDLQTIDDIILAYDQDKPGQAMAKEDAKLFDPGQIRIAKWKDFKDANDILTKTKNHKLFLSAIYNAKEYRPDGIVRLSQAWDRLWDDESIQSVPFPWQGLNHKLYGLRPREIVTLTAGSGAGKSAVCRELEYYLVHNIPPEDNVGILALEENIGRTMWGLMAIEANQPLHIREERGNLTREDYRKYFDATVGTGRYIAYDHFGSTATDNLLNQIKYMVKAMDCKWIFLDHLSIVVSDMEETGDERRTIDTVMTKLRQLTEETGAGLINVVHLRRMAGDKGHEQGGEISLNQLRGSHSIAHLSDAVIALERNQQAEDDSEANLTQFRVLKNRYAGFVGPAGWIHYDRKTGRLAEVLDKDEFLAEMSSEQQDF